MLDRTGTTTNPHTYVGKERYYRAADAMLYLLGLRYYVQALGRFISMDPIFDGFNWFVYVNSQCTRSTDPSGRYGPDLHNDMTREAANLVTRKVKGDLRGFSPSAARRIGAADQGVDSLDTIGSGWHFDYDGSRQGHHRDEFELALKADSLGACPRAYKHLGRSLHPIQDAWGHGPATPCEHLHMPNELWIDDIHYDTKWQWGPGKVRWEDPIGYGPWWYSVGYEILCHKSRVREFSYWFGRERSDGCMRQTRRILAKYLKAAKCCFEIRLPSGIPVV